VGPLRQAGRKGGNAVLFDVVTGTLPGMEQEKQVNY
tara:strand:+ start:162 stop:269 length:108 start_codon:yes stop_codon:yes gene_type:complete